MKSRINALELFAGIGGESLALRALGITTIGYCEIDPFCQAVIRSNVAKDRLDAAPLFSDVTLLQGNDLKDSKTDMIAGGFPCQGLSSIGARKGLYGDDRSMLVKHVYRLIDELKPKYVFLENTPLILKDGNYPKLLDEFINRGYRCAFVVLSASETGAIHKRNRWFFLAVRKGARPLNLDEEGYKKLERLFKQVPRSNSERRVHQRSKCLCKAYGNSVVPAQAGRALIMLNRVLADSTTYSNLAPTPLRAIHRRYPTVVVDSSGTCYQDRRYELPSTECRGDGFTVIPPQNAGGSPRTPRVRRPFKTQCIPTPRTAVHCAIGGASMTHRTTRDPANVLLASAEFYPSSRVPNESAKKRIAVSDEYWSIAMGFPRDWVGEPLKELMK